MGFLTLIPSADGPTYPNRRFRSAGKRSHTLSITLPIPFLNAGIHLPWDAEEVTGIHTLEERGGSHRLESGSNHRTENRPSSPST